MYETIFDKYRTKYKQAFEYDAICHVGDVVMATDILF